jgi:glycosyltransferase involved in cell wall biosynthesis
MTSTTREAGAVKVHRPVVVLQSFREPRSTTNPYIVMLWQSLKTTPGVLVRTFSWRTALVGRYDVLHAHWPEILIQGRSGPARAVRELLMLLLLTRLWLFRVPVVRTQHNLNSHSSISKRQRSLLGLFDRLTVHWISLNSSTPVTPGQSVTLIPHGHYRDWFAKYPRDSSIPGRFAYFGLIRDYKGLDTLVCAFRDLPGPYSLRIAGNPASPEKAEDLVRLAGGDERITFDFRFLPEDALVRTAREGELVVLPYQEMLNSGSLLAALSLDRPVLVPRLDVNEILAEEVGRDWVLQYEGQISAAALSAGIAAAGRIPPDSVPDLEARNWDRCGPRHLEAYLVAAELVHGRRMSGAGR